jgi:hypothetical protein
MKERFSKLGNKTKMIAGALALAALMAVNVQVGMNDGSTSDINLLGLEASVFAPAAVATLPSECGYGADPDLSYSGNWDSENGGCWTPPEPRTCVHCEYF